MHLALGIRIAVLSISGFAVRVCAGAERWRWHGAKCAAPSHTFALPLAVEVLENEKNHNAGRFFFIKCVRILSLGIAVSHARSA